MPDANSAGIDVDPVSARIIGLLMIAIPVTAAAGQYLLPVSVGVTLYAFRLVVLGALPFLLVTTSARIPLSGPARALFGSLYIWIVWGTLSVLWTPDPLVGFREVLTVLFGAAAALVIAVGSGLTATALNRIREGWVAAYALSALVALWELTTHQHLRSALADAAGQTEVGLVFSTFDNPNNYAAFIVLAFPFLLWSLGVARGVGRVIHSALCLTAPVLVILTAGRLALLTLGLQLILLLTFKIRRGSSVLWLVPIVSALVAASVVAMQANPRTLEKIAQVGAETHNGGSVSSRVNLTIDAVQFTADSYGMGAGAGSFEPLMMAGRGLLRTQGVINPHNFWTEILSQYGVLVFLPFVGCLLYMSCTAFRLVWYSTGLSDASYWTVSAVGIGLTGYWLAAVENSRFIPQPANWVFLGSMAALISALSREQIRRNSLPVSSRAG